MKKLTMLILGVSSLTLLGACASANEPDSTDHSEHNMTTTSSSMDMHHHSGEVPEGMKEASNPKYPVGTAVTLKEGHMPGMENAKATVVGAYDTTIYAVTYTPTTGGDEVKNHKWVVQEELENPEEPFTKGDTVVLEANHMAGMQGATATIDQAIEGTVYVVDYEPTDGGETVTNHMWMTEDELTAE
ncbi:YdhK family protein [Enterococcus saccharolyticus]|uniref:DUF1541 domain-containing protein n=1 Tax=Candidatus Enterococcus willemsii TaxID=1857215 RepID=A0ABQ6YXI7_9ENTE|nr:MULTISPECIES: YdhK family protein [Enterococcus]KAF1302702.1 hypothetical protein BAU17_05285 [Enterococcus sp. CU12B]MCD5002360.1 YdhK family protein [Enterococcus saccharolyticus]